MRNFLMVTTALALTGGLAAGPASAADMMSVGVGGYMQQWFGYASRDDEGQEGGWDTQADSEVHIKGSLESDTGLKFSVHMEIEGNNNDASASGKADHGAEIDESFARISGSFGQLEMGQRDHGLVRMHYGIKDVGVGLNAGDTQKWIPGTYLETSGHVYSGGDDLKLNYFTPRINGLQVGVSYAPDQGNENTPTTAPNGNDDSSWGAAVNFEQPFGDGTVSLSLGHQVISHAAAEQMFITGVLPSGATAGGTGDHRITAGQLTTDTKMVSDYKSSSTLMPIAPAKTVAAAPADGDALATSYRNAVMAQNSITNATDGMMMKGDDSNFTNFGVGVGFGAFQFNVAYATMDSGAYAVMRKNMVLNANSAATRGDAGYLALLNQGHEKGFTDANGAARTVPLGATVTGDEHYYNAGTDAAPKYVAESATNNDPSNDLVQETVVEDASKDFNVWGVSVTYTDGPMALSLGHMAHENDAGGERTATMLSGSYNLAPGVDWKTSVFAVEDTTSAATVTDGMNEGTAFVTGIALSF